MNRTALTSIAPDIFRKRLLVEGHFTVDVTGDRLRSWFKSFTQNLGLRTYGDPIIHETSGQGKETNQGFDAHRLGDLHLRLGQPSVSVHHHLHLRPL